MSIIVTQSLSQEIKSIALLKSTKHRPIQSGCWCSRALCINILRFVIWASLLEFRLFVCNFYFGLYSDPFQYDPKKDLAHCLRSLFLGSRMNVKNVHSSGHSPVSQVATDVYCAFYLLYPVLSPAGSKGRNLFLFRSTSKLWKST